MKKGKIPHTYVIVFGIVVLAAVFTWFIPGGQFDRKRVSIGEGTREVIMSDSFRYVKYSANMADFSALFDGFEDKADIIVFILIIGGAFWIMNNSRAIDVGIYSFLSFTKKIEHKKATETHWRKQHHYYFHYVIVQHFWRCVRNE